MNNLPIKIRLFIVKKIRRVQKVKATKEKESPCFMMSTSLATPAVVPKPMLREPQVYTQNIKIIKVLWVKVVLSINIYRIYFYLISWCSSNSKKTLDWQ